MAKKKSRAKKAKKSNKSKIYRAVDEFVDEDEMSFSSRSHSAPTGNSKGL